MKITDEQLEALQWLLPDNDVNDRVNNAIAFDYQGKVFATSSQESAAIFCDLLKRAVLENDSIFKAVTHAYLKKSIVHICCMNGTEARGKGDTELEAWILAVTELHGRMK